MAPQKPKSDICIGGKRIGIMRQLAQEVFEDSFLSIEVDERNRVFILRIDDKNVHKLNSFKQKYPLCKVIVYKEIDYSVLRNGKPAIGQLRKS